MYTITLGLLSVVDRTQSSVETEQALFLLSYILNLCKTEPLLRRDGSVGGIGITLFIYVYVPEMT